MLLRVLAQVICSLMLVVGQVPPSKSPPALLDATGEVEVSAAKVTRDTAPGQPVILTLVTIRTQPDKTSNERAAFAFLAEGDVGSEIVQQFRGTGRVVYTGESLSVWTGRAGGWRFETGNAASSKARADAKLRMLRVAEIRRYRLGDPSTLDHAKLAKTLFSGRTKR